MTTKKKRYIVPILKAEHCTEEYMDAVGLPRPWDRARAMTRWSCEVFGSEWTERAGDPIDLALLEAGSGSVARTPSQTAACFNRAIRKLGGSTCKPTGKPFPMKRKKGRTT